MGSFGKTFIILRIFFVLLLFIIFLQFFGFPSIRKYLRQDTMFVESSRDVEYEDYPVISVVKTTTKSLISSEACYDNQTNFEDAKQCLEEYSDNLNDTIVGLIDDAYAVEPQNRTYSGDWETIFTIPYWGRVYSSKEKLNLSFNRYLQVKLLHPGNDSYYRVDLHDSSFYYDCTEQMKDYERTYLLVNDPSKVILLYVDIEKISLKPEVTKCNNDEKYSFKKCTKVE